MRHVDAHRVQRLLVDNRHRRDIQREARGRLEGADTALAEHHVVVAAIGDVVGGGEPLGNGAGETAFVQHHLMRIGGHLADLLQQAEVLEVAGAHLQAVHIIAHELAMGRVHHLGKRLQVVLIAGGLHDLQGLFAETLERMRVSARLKRAAANPVQAQIGHALGHFLELLGGLHRARPGVNGDLVRALAEIGNGGNLHFAHTDGVSFMIFKMVA